MAQDKRVLCVRRNKWEEKASERGGDAGGLQNQYLQQRFSPKVALFLVWCKGRVVCWLNFKEWVKDHRNERRRGIH